MPRGATQDWSSDPTQSAVVEITPPTTSRVPIGAVAVAMFAPWRQSTAVVIMGRSCPTEETDPGWRIGLVAVSRVSALAAGRPNELRTCVRPTVNLGVSGLVVAQYF